MTVINTEEVASSVHERMFRTLLQTPHRLGDETLSVHREICELDPEFYAKLAVYAVMLGNNAIRDVNEIFVAVLFNSEHEPLRDAAWVMLQNFPPYQVARIMRYYTGHKEVVLHSSIDAPLPESGRFGLRISRRSYGNNHPDPDKRGQEVPRRVYNLRRNKELRAKMLRENLIRPQTQSFWKDELVFEHAYLNNRRPKGALRSAIRRFLKTLMYDRDRMEAALLYASKDVASLFTRTNTKPVPWVQAALFERKVEPGTRLHALQQLIRENDPLVQAQLVLDHKLPLRVVVSLMRNLTPAVWAALLSVMSPQEVLNSQNMLKRHGALEHPEIRKLVQGKLRGAAKANKKRVDALKGAKVAEKVKGLDADITSALTDVTDAQIKLHGKITRRTVLMIDRSISMSTAIEVGKNVAAAIAQSCEDQSLVVYLFNDRATLVEWRPADGDITTKSAWDKKLRLVNASGSTAPVEVVWRMEADKVVPEQIVIVTDEGENRQGDFAQALRRFCDAHNEIDVVIVRLGDPNKGYPFGASNRMERTLRENRFNVQVLHCESIDDVSIPNIISILSSRSISELIAEIERLDLPSRKEWELKNLPVVAK